MELWSSSTKPWRGSAGSVTMLFGLRQPGNRLEVEIVAQQALVDLAAERQRRLLLIERSDEDRRLRLNDGVERSAARLSRGVCQTERNPTDADRTRNQTQFGKFTSVHAVPRYDWN